MKNVLRMPDKTHIKLENHKLMCLTLTLLGAPIENILGEILLDLLANLLKGLAERSVYTKFEVNRSYFVFLERVYI